MQSSSKQRINVLPNAGDILFLLTLYLLFVTLPNFLFGDGSTGWHLVTGHYILDNGQVPRRDIISYTFPDKEWVAYEWLFDAAIALLERAGGLPLVAVAVASSIALLFLFLYETCRKLGCHFLLAMALTVAGMLVSAIHWLARPHIITFWGIFIFSRSLERFHRSELSFRRLLVFLSLTMVIWANCHPAFIIGPVMVAIYMFSSALTAAVTGSGEARTRSWSRCRALAVVLAAVAAASFITPYGLQLHEYIWHYLGQSQILAQTDEYGSPTFHGALQPSLLEILFFCLAVGLATTRKKPSLPQLLTVLAFAHLALSSVRSFPFFVIVALPFIAELLAHSRLADLVSSQAAPARWLADVKFRLEHAARVFDNVEFSCTMHLLPTLAVTILAVSCLNGGKALGVPLVTAQFPPNSKPTTTLDYLKQHRLFDRKGLNMDNWGGYIRYKTGERVFIDDRADFYGESFYLEYAKMSLTQPGWDRTLDKHGIEWVLFPRNAVLSLALKHHPGWRIAVEDEASYVLVREASNPVPSAAAARNGKSRNREN